MGQALALTGLLLYSWNVFLVRAAAPRLGQQVGFLVALVGNVLFGMILCVGVLMSSDRPLRVDRYALILFAVSGVFTSYLGRRGFFRTIQTLGPARASGLQITSPVLAAILGFVMLGDRLTPINLISIAAVLSGLLISSRTPDKDPDDTTVAEIPLSVGMPSRTSSVRSYPRSLPRREIAVGLISALAYAFGNVVRGDAVRQWDQPVIGGVLGAGAGALVYFAIHTSPLKLWGQVCRADRRGLVLWTVSGVVTVAGQICVIASTKYVDVAVSMAIASPLAVIVVPCSLLLYGNEEGLTRKTVAGLVLTVIGVNGLLFG